MRRSAPALDASGWRRSPMAMAILPTQPHAPSHAQPPPPNVRCPGCGRRIRPAANGTAIEPCACCMTRLIGYGRSLDVEESVRDRLYGQAPRGIEIAERRHR